MELAAGFTSMECFFVRISVENAEAFGGGGGEATLVLIESHLKQFELALCFAHHQRHPTSAKDKRQGVTNSPTSALTRAGTPGTRQSGVGSGLY